MLTEEKSRTVVIARRMQGRKPRQVLPGIQEPFGGGRPNKFINPSTFAVAKVLKYSPYFLNANMV